MAIAKRLEAYLEELGVEYELVLHPHTGSSMETAEAAHVPGDNLAKGVVVRDADEYLLVVVPADYVIELDSVQKLLQREVEMATEDELGLIFTDCEIGAVPPVGPAYGIRTVWDPNTSLGRVDEVFFESGDHREVVCVTNEHFHELMAPAERGEFSHHI
jgi:Ala-tRNA(Pro) deacylase